MILKIKEKTKCDKLTCYFKSGDSIPINFDNFNRRLGLIRKMKDGSIDLEKAKENPEKLKDLTRRTASDKILRDKTFNIAKNMQYDGYQRNLASMVYKFFDKKSASLADKSASDGAVKIKICQTSVLWT